MGQGHRNIGHGQANGPGAGWRLPSLPGPFHARVLVNVMLFQFPEHWIPILGRRIKNVHFKEFSKKGTDHSLDSFRLLLDGTTNWPAVMDALEQTGYEGYLTFEYFHPFLHYPEALIEQSSDALDRIMGRKAGRQRVS